MHHSNSSNPIENLFKGLNTAQYHVCVVGVLYTWVYTCDYLIYTDAYYIVHYTVGLLINLCVTYTDIIVSHPELVFTRYIIK